MSFSELTPTEINKILLFAVAALFALTFWKMTRRRNGSAGNGRRRFKPGAKPPYRPRARKHWKRDRDGKGDGSDGDWGDSSGDSGGDGGGD